MVNICIGAKTRGMLELFLSVMVTSVCRLTAFTGREAINLH